MNYQYLLFDLDGTLTDPKEGITKSVQYALESFGIKEIDLEKLTCFIGPPLVDSFQEFYEMSLEDAKKATEKYRERFELIGLYENKLLPGIKELLGELKEMDYVLTVATSKPWVFAEKILKHFDITHYFSIICGAELDGTRNAKAEVIEETLKRLSVFGEERKRAVMIGDRKHDILGAKACGLDSIGVKFGFAEEGELERAGADYIAENMEELREILKR